MSFSARIIKGITTLLLFAFFLGQIAPTVQAYSSPAAQPPAINLSPEVPNTQQTRAQTALIDILAAFTCQIAGINPIDPQRRCVTFDISSGRFVYAKAEEGKAYGAIGAMSGLIASTYNIPVHTSDYTNYLASEFGVVKKAHAQDGLGFSVLKPLQRLWTAMRDLAYLSFVVIFVLIGLGIMLRVKIDPRAVMTIQNQIPKIIVSILLITFSYAIAGLLVDLMWVTTYVGVNVISANNVCKDNPQAANALAAAGTNNLLNYPFYYVDNLFKISSCPSNFGMGELGYYVGQSLGDMISGTIGTLLGGDGVTNCSLLSYEGQMDCLGGAVDFVFSWMIGLVPALLVFLAILIQLFRVWFMLLKGYFYILLYTILAPGYILIGLIPGTQNFGFEQWLRHIVSALAMFPVTAFIFLLAAVVSNDESINSVSVVDKFIPPLIGNPATEGELGRLIALGAILIAPEVVNMMRNAFKAQQSKYVPQIFTGMAAGAGLAGATAGLAKPLFKMNAQGMPAGIASYYMYEKMGQLTRKILSPKITGSTLFREGTTLGRVIRDQEGREKKASESAEGGGSTPATGGGTPPSESGGGDQGNSTPPPAAS